MGCCSGAFSKKISNLPPPGSSSSPDRGREDGEHSSHHGHGAGRDPRAVISADRQDRLSEAAGRIDRVLPPHTTISCKEQYMSTADLGIPLRQGDGACWTRLPRYEESLGGSESSLGETRHGPYVLAACSPFFDREEERGDHRILCTTIGYRISGTMTRWRITLWPACLSHLWRRSRQGNLPACSPMSSVAAGRLHRAAHWPARAHSVPHHKYTLETGHLRCPRAKGEEIGCGWPRTANLPCLLKQRGQFFGSWTCSG